VPVYRSAVLVRDAVPDDVDALRHVFRSANPPAFGQDIEPGRGPIAPIDADPDQRLLVAVLDGRVVGGAHLLRTTLTPLGPESPVVNVGHLHVLPDCRRHGVGRSLMSAAVTWAENTGATHVLAHASVTSRDANRFMARLGLTQLAVLRAAPVAALRAKLPFEPSPLCLADTRHTRTVGQVLARRRSLKRAQTGAS
jgi:GNAT superfamily N-acetyltransferase